MYRYATFALFITLCLPAGAPVGDARSAELDLIQANLNADQVHANGKTALMLRARDGDLPAVRRLLAMGADVNRVNNNGGTPLMYAALGGNLDIVRLFIERGAGLNSQAKNGWCALMIATTKGHYRIVSELLERGADPNLPDVYGWTPLMRAVFEDRRKVAKLLLAQDRIDIDHQGENGITALHIAVVQGHGHLVDALVAGGADRSIQNHAGQTAYAVAAQRRRSGLMPFLKQ